MKKWANLSRDLHFNYIPSMAESDKIVSFEPASAVHSEAKLFPLNVKIKFAVSKDTK